VRIEPECWPCLLRRSVYEAGLVDPARIPAVVDAASAVLLREFGPERTIADVSTKVHAAVYARLGVADPYKEMKARSNAAAKAILPRVRAYVAGADDPFRAAVLAAVAGNVLDFGIGTHETDPATFEAAFEGVCTEGFAIDDTPAMADRLEGAKEVVVLGDNAGEIVLDVVLVEEIKRFGPSVTYVVRGAPILSDATWADVASSGMDAVADEVATTGGFAVGLDPEKAPDDLRRRLEACDLVVAKGMANWERLNGGPYRPIAFLLRTKCHPVARSLGVAKDANVARFLP
jgi:uncharacterized protein with ATP-grasp and redox domains